MKQMIIDFCVDIVLFAYEYVLQFSFVSKKELLAMYDERNAIVFLLLTCFVSSLSILPLTVNCISIVFGVCQLWRWDQSWGKCKCLSYNSVSNNASLVVIAVHIGASSSDDERSCLYVAFVGIRFCVVFTVTSVSDISSVFWKFSNVKKNDECDCVIKQHVVRVASPEGSEPAVTLGEYPLCQQ